MLIRKTSACVRLNEERESEKEVKMPTQSWCVGEREEEAPVSSCSKADCSTGTIALPFSLGANHCYHTSLLVSGLQNEASRTEVDGLLQPMCSWCCCAILVLILA